MRLVDIIEHVRAQKGSMQEVTSQIQFRSIVLNVDRNFVSAGERGQLGFLLNFSRMRHTFSNSTTLSSTENFTRIS